MYHILSHPVLNNYGGILQAYALQQTLAKLKYDSKIIHYIPRCLLEFRKRHAKRLILRDVVSIIRYLFNKTASYFPYYFHPWLFWKFRFSSLKTVKLHNNRSNLDKIASKSPFIVGSDQVWRYSQTEHLEDLPFFFLSFADKTLRKRSIAYAASFGTDTWEAPADVTKKCAMLAKDFKAISVREHSGISICKEILGVEAVQMPDPTLLLNIEDYNKLIQSRKTSHPGAPYLAAYLLDKKEEQEKLLNQTAEALGLKLQHLTSYVTDAPPSDRFPISIQQWLRYIRDAEFLITDSFHGCVFALIFNKPFVCLGNHGRGSARFDSLLKTFQLENRLLASSSVQDIVNSLKRPINWSWVNDKKNKESERGRVFLQKNLETALP